MALKETPKKLLQLLNVVKHAKVNKAEARVSSVARGMVRIQVKDMGVGIDTRESTSASHFGLLLVGSSITSSEYHLCFRSGTLWGKRLSGLSIQHFLNLIPLPHGQGSFLFLPLRYICIGRDYGRTDKCKAMEIAWSETIRSSSPSESREPFRAQSEGWWAIQDSNL